MDTNRINIINQDVSSSVVNTVETLRGYTVVRAPKGPIEPIYIPANNAAMIYDTLGYTSADYPDIQEVLDFNSQYGLFVSAPYDVAAANKVPVAYATPAGIFASSTPVTITGSRLEDVALDEAVVEGLNSFSANPFVLVPVGKEHSYFNTTGADASTVLTYDAGAGGGLVINLGFAITLSTLIAVRSKAHFINPAAITTATASTGHVMAAPSGDRVVGHLVFEIPGKAPIELMLRTEEDTSDYELTDLAGNYICSIDGDSTTSMLINTSDSRAVGLGTAVAEYFSVLAVQSTWSDEAFRNSVRVYWKAELLKEAIYGVVYPKYLSEATTTLAFTKQALGNKISFTVSEQVTPTSYSIKSITGSLLDQDVDGFGASLAFQERLADQELINVLTIKPFTGTIYTATGTSNPPQFVMQPVVLQHGERILGESLEAGWEEASTPDYDIVEVFFRVQPLTTGESTAFLTLASTHKLSRFVAPQHVAPASVSEDLPQLNYGQNYIISTNSFFRRSSFTRQDYETSLIGAYAAMILRAVEYKLGGAAPMFLNTGNVGGQLGVTVRKPKYRYTKDQLSMLDVAGYNPIILDSAYGVMVVGQKTAKGGELSDWSYVGHMSAFLYFLREARDLVLIPQLGKANNPYYRDLRKQQLDTLLRSRVEGMGRIWAQAVADTSEATANTKDIQAARKFLAKVFVKVDIFSEGVELILVNVDQYTDIL